MNHAGHEFFRRKIGPVSSENVPEPVHIPGQIVDFVEVPGGFINHTHRNKIDVRGDSQHFRDWVTWVGKSIEVEVDHVRRAFGVELRGVASELVIGQEKVAQGMAVDA